MLLNISLYKLCITWCKNLLIRNRLIQTWRTNDKYLCVEAAVELNSVTHKHDGENGVKEKEVLDNSDADGEKKKKEEKKKPRRHILALVKVRIFLSCLEAKHSLLKWNFVRDIFFSFSSISFCVHLFIHWLKIFGHPGKITNKFAQQLEFG